MQDHAGFIAAAYAVTGLALAGMVLAILLDQRALNRTLARLTEHLGRQRGTGASLARPFREDDHEP